MDHKEMVCLPQVKGYTELPGVESHRRKGAQRDAAPGQNAEDEPGKRRGRGRGPRRRAHTQESRRSVRTAPTTSRHGTAQRDTQPFPRSQPALRPAALQRSGQASAARSSLPPPLLPQTVRSGRVGALTLGHGGTRCPPSPPSHPSPAYLRNSSGKRATMHLETHRNL